MDVEVEIDRLYRTIINDGVEPQGTGRSTRMSQASMGGPIPQSEKYETNSLQQFISIFASFRPLYIAHN